MKMYHGWFLAFMLAVISPPLSFADHAHVDSLNSLPRNYIFSHIEQYIEEYTLLIEEAQGLDYPAGEARARASLGVVLYLNGRYQDGVEAYLEAIRLFEELNMPIELASAYGDLGYQMKRRNLHRAMQYMNQGIKIAETGNDTLTLCSLYNNFGVLQEMDNDLDSASDYYRRALNLKTALADSVAIPFSLNNLAGIAVMQGDYEEAAEIMGRSDAMRLARNDAYGLLRNRILWGGLYFQKGELDSAVVQYTRSLQMPTASEQGYLVSECYEQLAIIYEKQGNHRRALEKHRQFTAHRDSLFSVESSSRIAALEIEFETEKKDRLLAENRLAMAARHRTILILVAVLVVLMAGAVGVVRYQILKRRQLRKEMQLRGRLRRVEYHQRMADEKLRISRELHDNIGAQLTFLTSSLDNLSHQSSGFEFKQNLDDLSDFGRDTLVELRQTVWAMKNEDEGFDALVAKFQELKRQCSATGRKIEIEVARERDCHVDLSSGRLLNLFRIAQEAVQNAIKHTKGHPVCLLLSMSNQGLVLIVSDTGPGFSEKEIDHLGGVVNMRHRCVESGGEFDLQSDVSGTKITCRFPCE